MGEPAAPSLLQGCPPWCVTAHDPARGEDDWVHLGEPLMVTDGVTAVLCMSVDPATGTQDGPWVLIGDRQYTPAEAEQLGLVLSALARTSPDPVAAGERRSPCP